MPTAGKARRVTEWQLKAALRKVREDLGPKEAAFVDSITRQGKQLTEAQILWAEDLYLRHVKKDGDE